MENSKKFKESQRFNQWWFWGLLVFAEGVVIYRLWRDYSLEELKEFNFDTYASLIIVSSVFLLLLLLRLDVTVDARGVCYKWYPFQYKYQVIPWAKIESIRIRHYNAVADFGGYGLRYTFKTTAFIISGNYGIEITYRTKKRKFILGVLQPDAARVAIQEYFENITA